MDKIQPRIEKEVKQVKEKSSLTAFLLILVFGPFGFIYIGWRYFAIALLLAIVVPIRLYGFVQGNENIALLGMRIFFIILGLYFVKRNNRKIPDSNKVTSEEKPLITIPELPQKTILY